MGSMIPPHSNSYFYDAELNSMHSFLKHNTRFLLSQMILTDPGGFPMEEFPFQCSIISHCSSRWSCLLVFLCFCFQKKLHSSQAQVKGRLSTSLFPSTCTWLVGKMVTYLFNRYIYFFLYIKNILLFFHSE